MFARIHPFAGMMGDEMGGLNGADDGNLLHAAYAASDGGGGTLDLSSVLGGSGGGSKKGKKGQKGKKGRKGREPTPIKSATD